jgi:hypothetical protein
MPARKRPPRRRNPVAKALRVLKPKTVAARKAYKRRAKHPDAADDSIGQ